jgi:hypothetical protein
MDYIVHGAPLPANQPCLTFFGWSDVQVDLGLRLSIFASMLCSCMVGPVRR